MVKCEENKKCNFFTIYLTLAYLRYCGQDQDFWKVWQHADSRVVFFNMQVVYKCNIQTPFSTSLSEAKALENTFLIRIITAPAVSLSSHDDTKRNTLYTYGFQSKMFCCSYIASNNAPATSCQSK